MISLVNDTISKKNINSLISWLKTNPRLTKGEKTIEFEEKWSEWLGTKYSVFVNSGSSANLSMVYGASLTPNLRNKKIVVPAVSWTTTVTPAIHLGLEPILCDCNMTNLGVDINHLQKIFEDENPSLLIIVHVLGFPCDIKEISKLCKKHDVILLEDSCECIGSHIKNKKMGTYGLASSFSFYYGHHMSTIEGGMVSTNDKKFYETLKSIRSHGWDRDAHPTVQKKLRKQYNISDFRSLYTFYQAGFNFRSTDLQAMIGLEQLNTIDEFCKTREKNYHLYNELISSDTWHPQIPKSTYVSNFAYPIISPNIDRIVPELQKNDIECRPLICGSIGEQPYWIDLYGKEILPNATIIHNHGMYVPNNQDIKSSDIKKIAKIINSLI
jgi:CDP-6-deoxy-D-xylo-4-hexulose-3-dehydrase